MNLLAVSRTSVGSGLGAFAPGISAAFQSHSAEFQQSVEDLIVIDDADLPGISPSVEWAGADEVQMKKFLIQLSVRDCDDPIRNFAYTLDTANAAQVCEMITVADREVTIFTKLSGSEFTQQYLECSAAATLVDMRGELPGQQR